RCASAHTEDYRRGQCHEPLKKYRPVYGQAHLPYRSCFPSRTPAKLGFAPRSSPQSISLPKRLSQVPLLRIIHLFSQRCALQKNPTLSNTISVATISLSLNCRRAERESVGGVGSRDSRRSK